MRRMVPILAACALAAPMASAQDTAQLDRQIEQLRAELVELGRAEQAGQVEAGGQEARLQTLNGREAQIRARIETNRGQLARLLGALQMHQRRPPPPLLVNPRSARDAVRAAILIKAITPELEARGHAFAAQADALARVRRDAAVASEAMFVAESGVEDRRAEIERLLAEKRAIEQRLAPGSERQAAALAARVGSVGELIEELSTANVAPAATAPGRFTQPIPGRPIRRFGQNGSDGWTFSAQPGASVLAPAPGQVDYAGPLKGWGGVVILRVGGDYRLVLAGMEAVDVRIGRRVAAGEPVGRMGRPVSAAPELYMEVRNRTAPVDPARWLATSSRP